MRLSRFTRAAQAVLSLLLLALLVAACDADDGADEAAPEENDTEAEEPAAEGDEGDEAEAPAGEPQVLTAASFLPIDHDLTEPLDAWGEAVEEATDGQIVVDYDRGPESIPPFDQIDAVQSGVIDVNFNVTAYYEDRAPELRAFGLSELMPWEERESGFYELMVERHEQLGLQYVGRWLSNQSFFLWTEEPVERMEDFVDMRIRTAANYDRFLQSMDAVPVTVETPEVFTALESGLVDGFGWPVLGPLDLGWTDHAPYMVDHEFFNQNATILFNGDVWNGLSAEIQDAIIEATAEFEHEMAQHFADESEAERELLREAGVEFIELEDAEEFQQRPYDVEWEWLAGQIPDDLMEELQATATQ